MVQIPLSDARSQLDDLVGRVAHGETIALTEHGRVAAFLVPPQAMEDLEDTLALAEYQLRKARGALEPGIPHEEVRRILGLP
ncbi:type II toxin-antitoxin system Phd/YefM family antitoxin [Streptomyces blattellae]|uniref:type II toxin-antitoxin system Phd/YefM family antitoxin n=1 Tax=Streptomyces blattellae TaxID=2569855 RepID=UPI0012B7E156|nr:type II toxin-antitoxin system prevent-host-death family antitoxin [Streptomyces blattellae]